MIRHLAAVADLFAVDSERGGHLADLRRNGGNLRDAAFHVVGQKPTVRAGISTKLFLIEALCVVQRLLGRIGEDRVGLALEGGQIVEPGRSFGLFLLGNTMDRDRLALAQPGQIRRFLFALQLFTRNSKRVQIELHREEGFRHKGADLCFPLDDHGKRRGHDAPDAQLVMVEQGEKAGGIDANQPIGFGTAERGLIQPLIFAAVLEQPKALPNGLILHGGEPEALDRLLAAGELIHIAEDQLAFTPGVTGVDDLGHILPIHQGTERVKLLLLV